MRLRISARKSDLARLQAYMVGDALKAKNPQLEIEYRFKESLGDKNLTEPLWKIPEKGVFTEDFYGELTRSETDLVVHSWKDLPTELKDDTVIAATLPRADQRDLLLIKKADVPKLRSSQELRVFSSSPRREYNLTDFLKTHLPLNLTSVKFENVRGNIPTRIRKLLESREVQGLIVAKAALDRLLSAPQPEFAEVRSLLRTYLSDLEWVVLPLSINPNAAAQGALAVEILKSRTDLATLLQSIHDQSTFDCATKERAMLASFGGGCHQKIGVAVLKRSYGELTFLKGLTDQGRILSERRLCDDSVATRTFAPEQMWCSEVQAERSALPFPKLDSRFNALYISRNEAWPEGLVSKDFVWAAGLKTWRNLAQRGVWVHGASEGLGEQEDPQIDILAGTALTWAKLTHEEGFESASYNSEDTAKKPMTLIPTYSLKSTTRLSSVDGKESFFWNSGSQFLHALKEAPNLVSKFHACGPGNTYKVIRRYMEHNNAFDPTRLRIFLDQEDWRQQCTTAAHQEPHQ